MATQTSYQVSAAITALNAILGNLNVGGVAGSIGVWAGSLPASCETADDVTSTNLLVSLPLSITAFPTAVDNGMGAATATANAITATSPGNTGTAAYFRAYCSGAGPGSGGAEGCVIQGTCGLGGTDMVLTNISLVSAGPAVAVASWTVTLPDGSGVD